MGIESFVNLNRPLTVFVVAHIGIIKPLRRSSAAYISLTLPTSLRKKAEGTSSRLHCLHICRLVAQGAHRSRPLGS